MIPFLVLGLWSRQNSIRKALQEQLEQSKAQQEQDEHVPYVPCTFPNCIVEARGKHFNHTHI